MKKYLAKMVVSSVVYPDLYDRELQDSYGVMTPGGASVCHGG